MKRDICTRGKMTAGLCGNMPAIIMAGMMLLTGAGCFSPGADGLVAVDEAVGVVLGRSFWVTLDISDTIKKSYDPVCVFVVDSDNNQIGGSADCVPDSNEYKITLPPKSKKEEGLRYVVEFTQKVS
ncbi:MAG: hypothetical protein LBB47_05995 [Spirochaetaceae bacterium]|jgi:hypothetical protein|nr:hypothetical protein [Spirochaetaceae bacterium]